MDFKKESKESIGDIMFEALQDEEFVHQVTGILIDNMDGKAVNQNPLTQLPKSEKRLYFASGHYFESEEEFQIYCHNNGIEDTEVLDYYREFAGQLDVVRKTNNNGHTVFCVLTDMDGYSVYNEARSYYVGNFVWEYCHGSVISLYNAFKNAGVSFQSSRINDIIDTNNFFKRMRTNKD